jgi:hypothetical protein
LLFCDLSLTFHAQHTHILGFGCWINLRQLHDHAVLSTRFLVASPVPNTPPRLRCCCAATGAKPCHSRAWYAATSTTGGACHHEASYRRGVSHVGVPPPLHFCVCVACVCVQCCTTAAASLPLLLCAAAASCRALHVCPNAVRVCPSCVASCIKRRPRWCLRSCTSLSARTSRL